MPKWIWLLFLALIGLWVFQVVSEPRDRVVPSVESRAIDGLAAFGELLRAEKIPVLVNRTKDRKFSDNDLVIIIGSIYETRVIGGALDQEYNWPDEEDEEDRGYPARQFIVLDDDINSLRDLDSSNQFPTLVDKSAGPTLVLASEKTTGLGNFEYLGKPLVKSGPSALVGMDKGPKAVAIRIASCSIAMNGLIAEGDNARTLIQLVQSLLPEGGRVIFDESKLDIPADNLLTAIHPSVNSAWNQVLLTFGVVVYTLGRRFGTLNMPRAPQKTTSSLLLAFGNVLRRARAYALVNRLLYANIDARIRARLNLAKDATEEHRDMLLSAEQRQALNELRTAGNHMLSLPRVRQVLEIPGELSRR